MTNPLTKCKMNKADWISIFGIFTFIIIMISNNTIFSSTIGAIYFILFVLFGNLHNIEYRQKYKIATINERIQMIDEL